MELAMKRQTPVTVGSLLNRWLEQLDPAEHPVGLRIRLDVEPEVLADAGRGHHVDHDRRLADRA